MSRVTLLLILTLLTVPTCASLPQRDGTTVAPDLPPFPTWAPSRRGPVPVKLVRHLQCNNAPAYGCYLYGTHTIQIEDTLPLVLKWRYLRHEIVHSAMDAAGVVFDDRDEENTVAEAMASQQLVELLLRWPR